MYVYMSVWIMIRPVLFMFYTVESLMNVILMYFHIRGFLTHPLDFLPITKQLNHYFYFLAFYIFTVLTFFASINICTGRRHNIRTEIIRSVIAFLIHILISLLTLADEESDFHLMYLPKPSLLGFEQPIHPFIAHMQSQAVCSLILGVFYLLHAIIVIDVYLSGADSDMEQSDGESDYSPVRLYVLGEFIQKWLQTHEWFNEFANGTHPPI